MQTVDDRVDPGMLKQSTFIGILHEMTTRNIVPTHATDSPLLQIPAAGDGPHWGQYLGTARSYQNAVVAAK
jgi:hypothetical protein